MMSEELLIRFLTRTCTQEELLEVEKWISAGQANADWLFEMERVWSLKDELRFSDRKEIENAYRLFLSCTQQESPAKSAKGRRLTYRWVIRVAAAVIVGFGVGVFYMYKTTQSDITPQVVSQHEVVVPLGSRSTLVLADGTKVWLNAGSRLQYATDFGQIIREVYLEGEGYFDVTPDQQHPFRIQANGQTVEVLGTSLNVRAYSDEESIVTALIEGSVKVYGKQGKEVVLQPGQQLTYVKKDHSYQIDNFNPDVFISWKTGKYIFENTRFEDIIHILERGFNISIQLENELLKDKTYTARFENGESLENILDVIKRNAKYTYEYKNGIIVIR